MTQSLLRVFFNKYQVQDKEKEIEQSLKEIKITRKIGSYHKKEIIKIMLDNPKKDFTINEIAHIMDAQRSTISPRMSELRDMGLIVFSMKRLSRVTGKPNDAFKPVDNLTECVELID